ncbi:MAG: S41 family peptidase [Paludibacteraceae bacterium]|nr:S41 family peptidase [Paludibacteraceae bacterium]
MFGRIKSVLLYMLFSVTTAYAQYDSNIYRLNQAANLIINNYVDTINGSKLVDDAITDMLERLDPHSSFISAEEVKKQNEGLLGSFEGIGVMYQMLKDTMYVTQTISGAPAEKVGVRAGDRVIAVNDTSIIKMSTNDIQKRVRGPKGTKVDVDVVRRGVKDVIKFTITRDKIPLHSLDAAYMVSDSVGYIRLNRYARTTIDEYLEAYKKLSAQGMTHLILDLQGNGGGYLDIAQDLVSMFLDDQQLIVYTQGTHSDRTELRSQDRLFDSNRHILPRDMRTYGQMRGENHRVIVLVDESSASASEITSGALQDWDRALIVGRRTFGKGLVQRQLKLVDGSEMRLTTARYYTPSGRCIQKPYEKNHSDDYNKDLNERFKRGESMHKDSIHFEDSLKYETINLKRTVYGGGGIMPDIFVPLDTTHYSPYYRSIMAKGVMNNFCLKYLEEHRGELTAKYDSKSDKGLEAYANKFKVTNSMLDDLHEMAKNEDIKFNKDEFSRSKEIICEQLKALIARDIWGTGSYFYIMNPKSPAFREAVKIISDKKLYQKSFEH